MSMFQREFFLSLFLVYHYLVKSKRNHEEKLFKKQVVFIVADQDKSGSRNISLTLVSWEVRSEKCTTHQNINWPSV